jgi:hypothetical protein
MVTTPRIAENGGFMWNYGRNDVDIEMIVICGVERHEAAGNNMIERRRGPRGQIRSANSLYCQQSAVKRK